MSELLPELKGVMKELCVDVEEVEFAAGPAKAPVAKAVVAAHQFRWLVTQICYPHLGKLCWLVIPCALTALDHWSPEVKMLIFLQKCKGSQFETAWDKHKTDPDLTMLMSSFNDQPSEPFLLGD